MRKWLLRTFLVFAVCIFALSLIHLPEVKAWSTETTGVTLRSFQQNQAIYAVVGSYQVYATDHKLLFFTEDGALAKTWTVPAYTYGPYESPLTSIITVNSSYLIVAHTDYQSNANHTAVSAYLLNVNSLTSSLLWSPNQTQLTTSRYTASILGQTIFELNGIYYLLVASHASTINDAYLYRLSPNPANISTNSGDRILWGPTINIPSASETNTVYVISLDQYNGTNYAIWKINTVTPAFTKIGTGTGIGNLEWSQNYTYFLGYVNHNVTGNNYYDVVVWHPPAFFIANQTIVTEIIRFNDTYINDYRGTFSGGSAVQLLRPFAARYPATITGNGDLIDGTYNMVYIGGNYALLQFPLDITLSTSPPTWSGIWTPSTWQGKTHYYTTSNNVGGFQPSSSNVGIELDYANGKAIADLFTAPNPSFSYVYWLSPPATSQLDYDFSVTIGQAYTYYGEVFIGGTLSGNGNYRLYTRNDTSSAYALAGTGTFSAGQLNFTFIIGAPQVYWEINITMTDYSNTVKTIDHYILGYTSTVSPTPGSTIGDISGAASYGATFVVVFLPPLLIILGPALILGMYIGTPGFLGGLIMGLVIAVNTIWSNVALWAIAAIIFAGVLLLLFGAGGVGTAGGTQPSIAVRAYKKRQAKRAERKSEQEQRQRERGYLA